MGTEHAREAAFGDMELEAFAVEPGDVQVVERAVGRPFIDDRRADCTGGA